jgi:D-glycero-alpha-D-manno-heptose-7-phosphate kinase
MIITRTPFRVSFFGGGTDYPPWFREHGGAVLATAIDKYCYISCRWLPPFFEHKYRLVYSRIENVQEPAQMEHPAARAVLQWSQWKDGVEIHHDGDLPARSGLGSSSAFTVGLLHALNALKGQMSSKKTLASQAIHVEQNVIGENVGSQDQISAAYGGFNRIQFNRDGSFDVAPVIVAPARLDQLRSHLMLFYTGVSRIASEVAKSKIDNLAARAEQLHRMHGMVDEGIQILSNTDQSIEDFGRLLHQSWQLKRSLSDKVSSHSIDANYDAAMASGALGGKILGAGGGGFLLIFARPQDQAKVRASLADLVHVPFGFDTEGSRVVLYQPSGF